MSLLAPKSKKKKKLTNHRVVKVRSEIHKKEMKNKTKYLVKIFRKIFILTLGQSLNSQAVY